MNRQKLLFFVVLPVAAIAIVAAAIVWRAPLAGAFPSGARAFREAFGVSIAGDAGDGASEDIALMDDIGDVSEATSPGATAISVEPEKEQGSEPSSVTPSASSPASADDDIPVVQTSPITVSTVMASTTVAVTPSPPLSSPSSSCAFPSPLPASPPPAQKIIFNEIAWMGTTLGGNQEWVELRNISGSEVDLSGWAIMNASGKMKVAFGENDRIAAGGFLLLLRGSTTLPFAPAPGLSYSGDLRNAGDDFVVFDPACGVSDVVTSLAAGWPAGDNTTKRTMERDADAVGWHTSVNAGGTPGAENSVVPPPAQYKITVMFQGEGNDTITSDPAGMACTAAQCTGTFMEKTKLTLTERPSAGAIFDGWSGTCSGKGACTFKVAGDMSLTASFHLPPAAVSDPVEPSDPDPEPTSTTPTSTSVSAAVHILIAAVQIAGADSDNDFVKLYNPSSVAVDMGGWKLRKRSQTGAEYSLRAIPAGMAIGPGRYFVWANSVDGFSASIGADVSSTGTLATDNSVALFDADGDPEDALAWGTGTGQYGEGAPYPDSPAAGQVLSRKMADGAPVDTGNNADDFMLQ